MSFLIDTDLLSLLERKRVPARLAAWVNDNATHNTRHFEPAGVQLVDPLA